MKKGMKKILAVLLALCMLTPMSVFGESTENTDEVVYLSDLEWSVVHQRFGNPYRDKRQDGRAAITIEGVEYEKGVSFQPVTMIEVQLDGKYDSFVAKAGLDKKAGSGANASFEFYFDKTFTSEENFNGSKMSTDNIAVLDTAEVPDYKTDIVSKPGTESTDVKIDVKGVQTLHIYANPEGATMSDWVSLADAYFTVASESVDKSALEAAVKSAEELNEENYTSESFSLVKAALENAKAVLADENVTEEDVTKVIENLDIAIKALVEQKDEVVYLSDLEWSVVHQRFGNPYRDKRQDGRGAITIEGVEYEKGVSFQPVTMIEVQLDGKYDSFVAKAGLDKKAGSGASASFEFYFDKTFTSEENFNGSKMSTDNIAVLDTTEVPDYKTNVVSKPGTESTDVKIDVKGVQTLHIYSNPEGATMSDWASLADAYFTLASETEGGDEEGYVLESIEIEAPTDTLNSTLDPDGSIQLSVMGTFKNGEETKVVDLKEVPDVKLTYETKTLYGTTTINKPETTIIECSEDGIVSAVDGGVGEVTVTAEADGKTVTATKRFINRPFYREYEKTLTMKLFLNGVYGTSEAYDLVTFEEALELIKELDNLTRGIPKIIYLVGWQDGGHDHVWPSWDPAYVDNDLKREEDPDGLTSLRWLMREARKYNTTVSLHLNLFDISLDSPELELYKEHDAIAKDLNGELQPKVEPNSGVSPVINHYMVCYTQAWKEGLFQNKIDTLLEKLPELKEGGTIHVDAFHSYWFYQKVDGVNTISPWHAKNYGYNEKMETDTQRLVFEYACEKGVDITSEGVGYLRTNQFVGLQPMTWWSVSDLNQMDIPARLYTGGQGNDLKYGDNLHGEDIFIANMLAGKEATDGFLGRFCLSTLQFQYLNAQDRVSETSDTVTYTNGITATNNEIRQGDVIIRSGNNAFTPVLWNEEYKEIIAYSKAGYTDRSWLLPSDWSDVASVDIYTITKEGNQRLAVEQKVVDNKVTLTLWKDQAVSIVPAGTVVDYLPAEFDLTAPENKTQISVDGEQEFTWEMSEEGLAYKFVVAKDSDLKDVVFEYTTTDNKVLLSLFADKLQKDTKYYWGVAASKKEDSNIVTWNKGGSSAFYTDTTLAAQKPDMFKSEAAGVNKLKLIWNDVSEGNYLYDIYRKELGESDENYKVIAADVKGSEYIDENDYDNSKEYVYKLIAKNEIGQAEPIFTESCIVVYLSDLDWSIINAFFGDPRRDENQDGRADIIINGVAYEKGVSFQPATMIEVQLDGKYDSFVAKAGLDKRAGTDGVASFELYFDKAFTSEENFNGSKKSDDNITILDTVEVPDYETGAINKTNNTLVDINTDVNGVQTLHIYVDPEGTTRNDWISLANAYFTIKHTHSPEKVESKEATCTEPGNIEYWYCEKCGKYFEDEACQLELTMSDITILEKGHNYEKVERKEPTATEPGNIEYWICNSCGKYFKDANGENEILKEDTILEPVNPDTSEKEAAKKVEDLINAIGTVTLNSKDVIVAARTAYDALSAEVKALVKNEAVLQAAEAAYAKLEADAKEDNKKDETTDKKDESTDKKDQTTGKTDSVNTGDPASIAGLCLAMAASLGSVGGITFHAVRRKRKADEE